MFVKCESIYVKPRSKWSPAHSTYIVEHISPAEMLRFCDNPQSVIIREGRMSHKYRALIVHCSNVRQTMRSCKFFYFTGME